MKVVHMNTSPRAQMWEDLDPVQLVNLHGALERAEVRCRDLYSQSFVDGNRLDAYAEICKEIAVEDYYVTEMLMSKIGGISETDEYFTSTSEFLALPLRIELLRG